MLDLTPLVDSIATGLLAISLPYLLMLLRRWTGGHEPEAAH